MLEICTFSLEDAFAAAKAGADRIALCRPPHNQGSSPPYEWLFVLKASLHIPLAAMARPKKTVDINDAQWKLATRNDAEKLCEMGADRILHGALKSDGTLDFDHCLALNRQLGHIPAVLHHVFDSASNPDDALKAAIDAGFAGIMTGMGSHNMTQLKSLREMAAGQIEIIPARQIRSHNADHYVQEGFNTLHTTAMLRNGQGPSPKEIELLKRAWQSAA